MKPLATTLRLTNYWGCKSYRHAHRAQYAKARERIIAVFTGAATFEEARMRYDRYFTTPLAQKRFGINDTQPATGAIFVVTFHIPDPRMPDNNLYGVAFDSHLFGTKPTTRLADFLVQ